jgi:hypothetical protein
MNDGHFHGPPLGELDLQKLRNELEAINAEEVEIDGKKLLSGQCYHFSPDPFHVLFNTNCPDSLKEKIDAILHKYVTDESSTPGNQS